MGSEMILLAVVVALALIFDFINGFHDTANCIATAVATKALPPRLAVVLAAMLNLVGALVFTEVARTVGGGIADPWAFNNGLWVVMAALLSAIIWNLITWWQSLPSSSSHALIGSLAGGVLASAGLSGLHLRGLTVIIIALLVTPLLACSLGYITRRIIAMVPVGMNLRQTESTFRRLQVLTAIGQSFSHGTNDAQKTMGIITLALVASGMQSELTVPLWVKIAAATAMGLGTACGGWRIINTVGFKIFTLRPRSGVSADLAGVMTIMGATIGGFPISTTHVVSSAIVGVGMARRPSAVRWATMRAILGAWVFTLPATALLGALIFKVLAVVLHLQ